MRLQTTQVLLIALMVISSPGIAEDPVGNSAANPSAPIVNTAPAVTTSDSAERLTIADVVASTYRSFPALEQVRLEAQIASGRSTSAFGAFDTRLQAHSLSEPTGFYRNYRHALGVMRRTWWGGYVEAGYRLGRGDFAPWYKERETNRGGEFGVGVGIPLLQGRAIDASRIAVFQAGLSQQAVGPQIQAAVLEHGLAAAQAYWEWIAAGSRLEAQIELLDLAKERQQQFEDGAKAGKFPQIDVVFNKQLLAERASKQTQAEQKFRAAGFKLSLYLRDESGSPLIPDDNWLPKHFPIIDLVTQFDFNTDYQAALSRRPELTLLTIESQQIQWDRRLALNQRMPALDLVSEATQDTGAAVSSANDKGRFELLVGVQSDFPIQRRNAQGKVLQTSAKISQLEQKIILQRDKIGIELRTGQNALLLAGKQVEQIDEALKAAFETLQAYRFAFQKGFKDLLYLNILETKANEVEIYMIDAQRDWFIALAQTQAAAGLDPLEQAMAISALPESKRLGPGDMPKVPPLDGAGSSKDDEDATKKSEEPGTQK
jgi:outer membrane protein TolC